MADKPEKGLNLEAKEFIPQSAKLEDAPKKTKLNRAAREFVPSSQKNPAQDHSFHNQYTNYEEPHMKRHHEGFPHREQRGRADRPFYPEDYHDVYDGRKEPPYRDIAPQSANPVPGQFDMPPARLDVRRHQQKEEPYAAPPGRNSPRYPRDDYYGHGAPPSNHGPHGPPPPRGPPPGRMHPPPGPPSHQYSRKDREHLMYTSKIANFYQQFGGRPSYPDPPKSDIERLFDKIKREKKQNKEMKKRMHKVEPFGDQEQLPYKDGGRGRAPLRDAGPRVNDGILGLLEKIEREKYGAAAEDSMRSSPWDSLGRFRGDYDSSFKSSSPRSDLGSNPKDARPKFRTELTQSGHGIRFRDVDADYAHLQKLKQKRLADLRSQMPRTPPSHRDQSLAFEFANSLRIDTSAPSRREYARENLRAHSVEGVFSRELLRNSPKHPQRSPQRSPFARVPPSRSLPQQRRSPRMYADEFEAYRGRIRTFNDLSERKREEPSPRGRESWRKQLGLEDDVAIYDKSKLVHESAEAAEAAPLAEGGLLAKDTALKGDPTRSTEPRSHLNSKYAPAIIQQTKAKRKVTFEKLSTGVVVVRNALDMDTQMWLVKIAQKEGAKEDHGFWENDNGKRVLNSTETRGRVYDRLETYEDGPELGHFARSIVGKVRERYPDVPKASPTHLLLLHYSTNRGIGWHADDAENDGMNDSPIISFCLGNTCKFGLRPIWTRFSDAEIAKFDTTEYKQHSYDCDPMFINLASGDVIIWGGINRMLVHNVEMIHPNTAPGSLRLLVKNVRYNFTFRDCSNVLGREEEFKYYIPQKGVDETEKYFRTFQL